MYNLISSSVNLAFITFYLSLFNHEFFKIGDILKITIFREKSLMDFITPRMDPVLVLMVL